MDTRNYILIAIFVLDSFLFRSRIGFFNPVLATCSWFNSLLPFRFSYNAIVKVQVVSYSMTVSVSRLEYASNLFITLLNLNFWSLDSIQIGVSIRDASKLFFDSMETTSRELRNAQACTCVGTRSTGGGPATAGLSVHRLDSFACPNGRSMTEFRFLNKILDTPILRP